MPGCGEGDTMLWLTCSLLPTVLQVTKPLLGQIMEKKKAKSTLKETVTLKSRG